MTPEEKKKEYDKQYRIKNKVKIAERTKEYKKQYNEKNKEYIAKQQKEYQEKNKEHIAEKQKEYYIQNKEKIAEQRKAYNKVYKKTEASKKSYRISHWNKRGVISDDFNALYDIYINTTNCEDCNVELVEGIKGNNWRCLDHDHKTGLFRGVVCNTCNLKRG